MLKKISCSVLILGLVACGGGGGGASPTPPPPPPPPPPPANTAPAFTSSESVSIDENALGIIFTVTADDSDGTISDLQMLSEMDAAEFDFDSATGQLSLDVRLDYEAPSDANADNIYNLRFEATDDDGAATLQDVTVTVSDAVLDAGVPPSDNFELDDWKLQIPIDEDGNFSGGDSDQIDEWDLSDGHESEFFFTADDGGMVLRAPPQGATTSENTIYTRTELREMLRRGDTSISTNGSGDRPNGNNWAFSSAPASAQATAGGIDGTLRVTMAVNSVTTTGEDFQIGRLIIGQIHAADDEPIRLYYRKLPGNMRGTIYAAHEISGGDDIYYDIIGGRSSSEPDPANGFELDERFTYEIDVVGNDMTVTIWDGAGSQVALTNIDMTDSGYDVENDYMYFKAGVYHVNNSADADEWAQVTIYELENSHINYPF